MMMFLTGLRHFQRAVTLLKYTYALNPLGVTDGWSENLCWECCCEIRGRKKGRMAQREDSVEKANQGSQKGAILTSQFCS